MDEIKHIKKLKGDLVFGNKISLLYQPPPSNHPNAVNCPQCEELTWKDTELCCHCGFSLENYRNNRKDLIDILIKIVMATFAILYFGYTFDVNVYQHFIVLIPVFSALAFFVSKKLKSMKKLERKSV